MSLKIRKGDKMEYRYKDIYLEETIEEIFPKLNNSNTEYECSTFSLAYRPYEYVEVTIYLKFGEVLLIKIFCNAIYYIISYLKKQQKIIYKLI